jgi:predicted nucleic acid-binding protein
MNVSYALARWSTPHDCLLVTNNTRHFERIAAPLMVVKWI